MAIAAAFSASGAALVATLPADGLVRVVSARDLRERFRYLLPGAYFATLCGDTSLLAVAATHGTVRVPSSSRKCTWWTWVPNELSPQPRAGVSGGCPAACVGLCWRCSSVWRSWPQRPDLASSSRACLSLFCQRGKCQLGGRVRRLGPPRGPRATAVPAPVHVRRCLACLLSPAASSSPPSERGEASRQRLC